MADTTKNIPEEVKHFNWGAFLLNWIWGIMHKKYITLLYFPACLIPIAGPLAISIWFGIEGNKWAWESQQWDSVEKFNQTQQNWVRLWFVLFVLGWIIAIKIIYVIMIISNLKL